VSAQRHGGARTILENRLRATVSIASLFARIFCIRQRP
jgi:hypothetical protein